MKKRKAPLIKLNLSFPKPPVLSYFHSAFKTKIVTDANKQGFDAVLLQGNTEGAVVQLATFASCSLSDFETKFSQIEHGVLPVIFSCEQFKNYTWILIYDRHRSKTASQTVITILSSQLV